ncbi:MAG: hypothetical protein R3229_17050 [Alphaproteobacteria bacterium]|nr:hypothetical protein [Alphaproteobacteria bacterium]
MFIVGPYLFSGEELDLYLRGRKAEALAAAEDEAAGAGGAELVRRLYDRFSIPDTQMHVDKAHFTEERPLNDEECEAIGVADEDRAKYKLISIAVPYSGDAHLFTDQPTIYSAHQPQAEVKDGALHMTWFLAEVEEYQLENNFKRQVALIERTLEVTQWQAMGCNQEIMAELKAALMGAGAGG